MSTYPGELPPMDYVPRPAPAPAPADAVAFARAATAAILALPDEDAFERHAAGLRGQDPAELRAELRALRAYLTGKDGELALWVEYLARDAGEDLGTITLHLGRRLRTILQRRPEAEGAPVCSWSDCKAKAVAVTTLCAPVNCPTHEPRCGLHVVEAEAGWPVESFTLWELRDARAGDRLEMGAKLSEAVLGLDALAAGVEAMSAPHREELIRRAEARGWCPVSVELPGGATVEAWGLADREPDCAECHESVYRHSEAELRECAEECERQLRRFDHEQLLPGWHAEIGGCDVYCAGTFRINGASEGAGDDGAPPAGGSAPPPAHREPRTRKELCDRLVAELALHDEDLPSTSWLALTWSQRAALTVLWLTTWAAVWPLRALLDLAGKPWLDREDYELKEAEGAAALFEDLEASPAPWPPRVEPITWLRVEAIREGEAALKWALDVPRDLLEAFEALRLAVGLLTLDAQRTAAAPDVASAAAAAHRLTTTQWRIALQAWHEAKGPAWAHAEACSAVMAWHELSGSTTDGPTDPAPGSPTDPAPAKEEGSPELELHARDVAMVGGIDPEGGYRMPSPAETPWRATAAALEAAGVRSLGDLPELRQVDPAAPLEERALRWMVLSAGLEGLCTPDFLAARLGAVTADVAEALLELQAKGLAEPLRRGGAR